MGDKSRLIATVPGRGYQFVAQVYAVEVETGIFAEALPEARAGDIFVQRVRERTRIVYDDAPPAQLAQHEPPLLLTGGSSRRARVWLWVTASALCGALIALAVLAVYFVARLQGAAQLRISSYTQITHDGHTKFIGGTDGSRIYFTLDQPFGIAEVSVSGGAVAPILTTLPNPWAGDVSPDGSTLLLISQIGGMGPADSLWSLRLLGGPHHYLPMLSPQPGRLTGRGSLTPRRAATSA